MTRRVRFEHGCRVAVLLLAVCLAADVAMPMMPGAFVWDTRESIDAVRGPRLPGARAVPDLPFHPSRHAASLPVTTVATPDVRSHGGIVRRPVVTTALPRLLPASETFG
jgi:hypothetical protein